MSFPAYPDYKDSGVAWLGEVPSHWTIGRIKDLFEIRKRIAGELGYDVLSITQSGIRVKDVESNDGQQAMDYSKYQIVCPGDFAMNHMDLLTGWIDIAAQSGVTSPDYRVFAARNPATINDRFYLSVFQMAYTARQFYPFGQGSSQLGRWRLPTDAFYAFPIPVPPVAEQGAIHSFLDRETAKIDALVAEQERLIALLKEKRQAVISRAVTKGLNLAAPMKDSGIEWLGEIPAHWDVIRIKQLASIRYGIGEPPPYRDDGIPLIRATNVDSGEILEAGIVFVDPDDIPANRIIWLQPGDIIVVRSGAHTGDSAIIREHHCPAIAGFDMILRASGPCSPDYLQFCLLSSFLEDGQIAIERMRAAQPHLNTEELGNCILALPPHKEQRQITEFLLDYIGDTKDLLRTALNTITLLQERRAALISAAVTGKIDVRAQASQNNVISIDSARPSNLPPLRAVVGAYAIRALGPMGRMAVMKGGYLAEAHVGVSELGGSYQRKAAGPYSSAVIDGMERDAALSFGIQTIEPVDQNGRVTYRLPQGFVAPSAPLKELIGEDRAARLIGLLDLLKGLSREGIEATATLYVVWNDLLAAGEAADDNAICNGVLNDWHPEKAKKFKRADLDHWLEWMRRNDLVPDGSAPRTDNQGSLFG